MRRCAALLNFLLTSQVSTTLLRALTRMHVEKMLNALERQRLITELGEDQVLLEMGLVENMNITHRALTAADFKEIADESIDLSALAARLGNLSGTYGGFNLAALQAEFSVQTGASMRELDDKEIASHSAEALKGMTQDELNIV